MIFCLFDGRRGARWPVLALAGCLLISGGAIPPWAAWSDEDNPPVDYDRQIRPLLAGRCYACHGPDEEAREADVRLDRRDGAVDYAIKPGSADKSPMVERISSTDPDVRMPPPRARKPPLTAEQIALVRRWIDQGAKFGVHWSFARPICPSVPPVKDPSWPRNPIDHFIAAAQERRGCRPSPEADRRTLIRRLSFDLTGLPTTPEEVAAFAGDASPDAYEKLVERLLASPHYGERMAVYWLDLVRFADTGGYHSDNHRDLAPYRDYVIASFNRNRPFDQFTIEQLAGDLLPEATNDQKIASGYNRLLMTTEEGGAQPKEYRAKYAADRVRNVSEVWLAVTLACCQCHDHKFDPLPTRDFYRMAAFFADLQEKDVGRQTQVKLPTSAQAEQLKRIDEEILPTLISVSGPPHVTRVLPRGNWMDESGEVVTPGVPAVLPALDVGERRPTRLDLARWLVARDNPLVARVLVNRLWKLFFGRGLVKSLGDFGSQGALPTHPRLLDWLAVELVDSGWNVKETVRRMVTSATYRQSSLGDAAQRRRDPQNLWLARQGRFRLDAEMVRDNALAISGLLVRTIGGRSVKPYQPAGYWAHLNFPKRVYKPDVGENQYRRGLYTYWQRTFLHPSLSAFDAPSREKCTVQRPPSNTPLQALVLLNDPTYVEAARVFAQRTIREGGDSVPKRLDFMMQQALNRRPTPAEASTLTRLLDKHRRQYAADAKAAAKIIGVGQSKPPDDVDSAELAAWTSVGRVILNLHETITRY